MIQYRRKIQEKKMVNTCGPKKRNIPQFLEVIKIVSRELFLQNH